MPHESERNVRDPPLAPDRNSRTLAIHSPLLRETGTPLLPAAAAESPHPADPPNARDHLGGTYMSGTTTAAERCRREAGAGANRWVVLVVLCVSLLLVAVDATVLHVAVPAVTEDLRPGAMELLWIVDVYPLVCASLLILFGTLGDRVGRPRVVHIG